ncbi:hypothetical protein L204_101344 [Cryptococcus depauperatus]|nr:hypothetical protein L204_04013 [Cryptococcus depauperatus CBS 7855]
MLLNPRKTVLLICDVQERFRPAIHGFDSVASTICKLVKASQALEVPVFVTEQNPKALGSTVKEIKDLLDQEKTQVLGIISKTKFSMLTEDTMSYFKDYSYYDSFILTGIESHICVLQTAIDLLRRSPAPRVYLPADAISSCNKEEIPLALQYLRQQGAIITTSESLIYRLTVDAKNENFKYIAKLTKDEKENTTKALQTLVKPLFLE